MSRLFRRKSKKFQKTNSIFTAKHLTPYHIQFMNDVYIAMRNEYIDLLDDEMIKLMYSIEDKHNTVSITLAEDFLHAFMRYLDTSANFQNKLYAIYDNIIDICNTTGQSLDEYVYYTLHDDLMDYTKTDSGAESIRTPLLRCVNETVCTMAYGFNTKFLNRIAEFVSSSYRKLSNKLNQKTLDILKDENHIGYIMQFSKQVRKTMYNELLNRRANDEINRQKFLLLYAQELMELSLNSHLEYFLVSAMNEVLDFLQLFHVNQGLEEDVNIDDDFEKYQYRYIDKYLELNKMANDNGYQLIRCNGDHGIFENSNGHIVVIPQGRAIGKGLSITIQKGILGEYDRNKINFN